MRLHKRGWQVYRAYIDSNVDFILTKYWCTHCKKYAEIEKRKKTKGEFPTDCCAKCLKPKLIFIMRFIQVKTSEGISAKRSNKRSYSFHAKLRSNIDPRAFYAWIALVPTDDPNIVEPHFYIFHHTEIGKFDNLDLPSYQKTDNQKTTLHIDGTGKITNKGRKHSFDCFNDEFYDNFDKLDKPMNYDT